MKLSIVTLSRNDLTGLRATLASLAEQSSSAFEQWVIDGGSTDGTREFLEYYRPAWSFHSLSEEDGGIYDAMNKGTARATGEFVWFLNSGDLCADPGTIEGVLRQLGQDTQIDVLHGRVWAKSRYGLRSVGGPVTSRAFRTRMPICHQGIIYRRSLLRELPYPTDYRIISDWIVTRTLYERGARFSFLDRSLAIYDLAGLSSRAHGRALREKLRYERTWSGKVRVLLVYGGHILALWLTKKTGLHHCYKTWQHAKS